MIHPQIRVIKTEKRERYETGYVKHWTQKEFRTNNYLFEPSPSSHSKNHYIQPSTFRWKLHQLRIKTGLNDVYYVAKDGRKFHRITAHTGRHWFITKIQSITKDTNKTAKIVGHKDTRTTEKYIYNGNLSEMRKQIINQM